MFTSSSSFFFLSLSVVSALRAFPPFTPPPQHAIADNLGSREDSPCASMGLYGRATAGRGRESSSGDCLTTCLAFWSDDWPWGGYEPYDAVTVLAAQLSQDEARSASSLSVGGRGWNGSLWVGAADDRVCPSAQQPLKRKCVPETFGCCWLFELLAFFVLGSSALACCARPEQLTSEEARESTSITWVIGRIGCWDPRSPERLPAPLLLFGIGAVRCECVPTSVRVLIMYFVRICTSTVSRGHRPAPIARLRGCAGHH